MKVIDMCDECGTFEDLVLQEGKKTNKFGKMYYLKERICLVQRKPSKDYNEWVSDKGEKHLRLGLTAELKKELMGIENAATAQIPSLDFKGHDDGNDDDVYIKFGKKFPTMSSWAFPLKSRQHLKRMVNSSIQFKCTAALHRI